MVRKVWALLNIAIGLFLIVIVGGKFLIQALSIIAGLVCLSRGISMLTMARFASRFQTNFFEDDRLD